MNRQLKHATKVCDQTGWTMEPDLAKNFGLKVFALMLIVD